MSHHTNLPAHFNLATAAMSLTVTSCYQVTGRSCHVHGALGHPSCIVSQTSYSRASPTSTTITMYAGRSPTLTISPLPAAHPLPATTYTRRSPAITISPLPGISPLPASLQDLDYQDTYNYNPSSPVMSALVLTTPSINPLVAYDSGPCQVHCDLSKDPIRVRVSGLCGRGARITPEQDRSPVVEGALHSHFRIMFDHPILERYIDYTEPLTVGDLLAELHLHLHKRVRSGEMHDLKNDMDLYQTAVNTQVKRCGAAFDSHAEWDQGMKRIDMLGKESKFCGVYLDSSAPVSDYLTLRVVFGK